MLTLVVRLIRYLGWAVLLGSIGVVIATVLYESILGPVDDQHVWPTPRLWRCYGTTLWMAATATASALILALPAAFALVQARRRWQRSLLHGVTIIPLLTMPSIFAYAWMLLATSQNATITTIIRHVGWNTPGAEPLQAAWVLATWLWPIPALILAASFKHGGAQAHQLACIDASPLRAFLRGALPVMRAPLMAALAIVFILSAIDSTIPPLMNATQVWSVEMLANASIAMRYDRPAAYLFWYSWPMLATITAVAAAAIPGIRRMTDWADDPDAADTGTLARTGTWAWGLACLIAASITLFPILVFAVELAGGRTTPLQAVETAWKTSSNAVLATLIVAGLTGLAATALAVAVLDGPNWPRPWRLIVGAATALAVAAAVLPPELTSTALVAFFSDEWISPRDRWNLYDNSPFVWTAAMIARFGFVTVCVARLLNRRVPADISAQARTDGANRIQCIAYTRLPFLRRGLLAAGMMVACLTLSEAAASVLVQPPQFFGGSLAVHVDSLMHYGRQNETIALSLMLILPAVLIATAVPLLSGKRRNGDASKHRNGDSRIEGFKDSSGRRRPPPLNPPILQSSNPHFHPSSFILLFLLLPGCHRTEPDVAAVDAVIGGPGLGAGEFSYPRGIAVSPADGCVFVVDKSARIQRFSPNGQYQHQWRMPEYENGKPTGIYVHTDGRVWVPDTHYHRVIVFDREGQELFRFGQRGEGPGQFIFPTNVVIDRDEYIYVGEYGGNDRISKFSPDRKYLFSFADRSSGEGSVERPTQIVIDEDGILWVSDACHHRICRYDRDGTFLSTFGSPGTRPGNLNYPYGLALEEAGTLLVADRGNNRIVRFDRNGKFLGSWGTHGRSPGQILQPWGVAVAKDQRIYCLDSWNNRVQLIDW